MTLSDDYPFDMTESIPRQRDGLDDLSIEALLGARSRARSTALAELAGVLTELRAVVDAPPPSPSQELARMLEVGVPSAKSSPPKVATRAVGGAQGGVRQARRALIVAAVGSLVSLPLMGVAAAQDRLPDAAQHVVATVIKATTPFTVADPHVKPASSGSNTTPKRKRGSTGAGKPATGFGAPGTGAAVIVPDEAEVDGTVPDGIDVKGTKIDRARPDKTEPERSHAVANDPSRDAAKGNAVPSPLPSPSPTASTNAVATPSPSVEPPAGTTGQQSVSDTSTTLDVAPSPTSTAKPRPSGAATPGIRPTRGHQVDRQAQRTSEPSATP